jgi:DNA invertase Pin-like site-specific DNA recombinase
LATGNSGSRELILERIRAGLRVAVAPTDEIGPARPFFAPIENPLGRFEQECKANLMELAITADGTASAQQLASVLGALRRDFCSG